MERPTYDDNIARQNHMYATDVLERFREKPKNSETLYKAVFEAFILGAGGYQGSFDAAAVLEYGGMALLLGYLGVADADTAPRAELDKEVFEEAIRAAVDFGASYDDLEKEIPQGALSDTDITGELIGPLARRFNLLDPTPWRSED